MTEESHEPTQSDAMQIGIAGSEAVDPNSQTPAQAQEASRQAMHNRAQELKVTLAPEALDQMSAKFIDALRQAGAFREESPESPPETPPAAPAAESPGEQPPPVKKTLAQRLLGDK